MGGVRGFGPDARDEDVAGPIGRFGDTGGHRQDLDSAGAYVVAEEAEGFQPSATAGQYVPGTGPLRATGGGGTDNLPLVVAPEEAATLSAGGHPNSNDPGRKREDDSNLVAYRVQPGTVETDGPNTLTARETDEAEPLTASDAKKSERGTLVAEVDHYYVDGGEDATLRATGSKDSTGKQGNRLDGQPMIVAPEEAATLVSNTGDHGYRPVDNEQPQVIAEVYGIRTRQPGANGEGITEEEAHALNTWGTQAVAYHENADGKVYEGEEAPALRGTAAHQGKGAPVVGFIAGSSPATGGVGAEDEIAPTLGSEDNGSTRTPTVAYTKTHGSQNTDDPELWEETETMRPLDSTAFATDVVVEDEEAQTFDWQVSGGGDSFKGKGRTWIEDKPGETRSLSTTKTVAVHQPRSAVRRLTPTECERLQGFPDDWTVLPDGTTPDGPRYSALGDAVTVNTAYWIVRRLLRRRELGLE